jgi:hypothetical protein
MSQNFKLRSDEIQENDVGKDFRNPEVSQHRIYDDEGHIRNISFILPEGKRIFLNYAYLISGECSSDDETLTLRFTSGSVVLQGFRLSKFYNEIFLQKTLEVGIIDKRYNATISNLSPIINSIKVIQE